MANRKGIQIDSYQKYDLSDWSSFSDIQNHLVGMRDDIRSHLDDGSQTDWMVSDIFQWEGQSSDSIGMGFIVRHNNSSSWTGHEWLFILSTGRNGNSYMPIENVIQNVNDYVIFDNSGRTVSGTEMPIFMMYNHDGTSSSFDVNLSSDGTLLDGSDNVVGDFGAPLTNPYSDIVGFLPSHDIVLSTSSYDASGTNRYDGKFFFFDHNEPAVMYSRTYGYRPYPRELTVAGQIINPDDPVYDPYWAGQMTITLGANDPIGYSSDEVISGLDQNGSRIKRMNMRRNNSLFSTNNSPRPDGKFPWAKIAVETNSYFKGHLNPNLIRQQGAEYSHRFQTFQGPNGPFIKWHRSMVHPWFSNEPVWPHGPDVRDRKTYSG